MGNRTCTTSLTAEDLQRAENHTLRQSQITNFTEELASVRCKLPLPRGSRIKKVAVILGDDGLLRLSGRINAAQDICQSIKNPILLDGKDHAVRLLILYYHEKAAHANTETVLNEIRQKFWVLKLRSTVRAITSSCQLCRIRKAAPLSPPVGDLPKCRLAHHRRAFTYVGLDYFGPIQVSIGRRTEKRYGALYTCLTTRAVHLEIVHSLSADSAVMSLRRFVFRRGTPSEIWSDNGTAFVGASKILRDLYGPVVDTFAANNKIQWKFIPPAAPFMGGAWERLVRSIKTALKFTLEKRTPSEEILATLLAEAEALVNSRPLTHVPLDPDSPEALTPTHFLLGSSSGALSTIQTSDRDLVGREQWKKVLRLADYFWKRWLTEYLPTLTPRITEGGHRSPRLDVGDLVLIIDNILPRGSWLRGRITKIFPGQDDYVRVADVVTSGGTLRRPARKLVRLPIS